MGLADLRDLAALAAVRRGIFCPCLLRRASSCDFRSREVAVSEDSGFFMGSRHVLNCACARVLSASLLAPHDGLAEVDGLSRGIKNLETHIGLTRYGGISSGP